MHFTKALVKVISTSNYKNRVQKNYRNGPVSANVGTHRLQKPQQIPVPVLYFSCLMANNQTAGVSWEVTGKHSDSCLEPAVTKCCVPVQLRDSWIHGCLWVGQSSSSLFQKIEIRLSKYSSKTWPSPFWSNYSCWLFPMPSICLSQQDFGILLCPWWGKRHQSWQQSGHEFESSAYICAWHLLLTVLSWILLGQPHMQCFWVLRGIWVRPMGVSAVQIIHSDKRQL